jgi:hypothetical protein
MGRLRLETSHTTPCAFCQTRMNSPRFILIGLKPDSQTAKTTAATASAPNKIIEHVIQLEISPFSFVCRIA